MSERENGRDPELERIFAELPPEADGLSLQRWKRAVLREASPPRRLARRYARLAAAIAIGFFLGRVTVPGTGATVTEPNATIERIYTKVE